MIRRSAANESGAPRRTPASAKAAAALFSAALVLSGFQAPAPPAAAPSGAPDANQNKTSIEGAVLDAVTGKPVRDAALLLADPAGGGTPVSTKSNEEGHFSFTNLKAGSYLIVGDHPRYARQTYGSRNGLLGGTFLTLAEGQQMRDVKFPLQPNAVASGKVVDSEGEPIPTVLVMAVKRIYQRGKPQYLPVATAMTNDLGEYRLANLAAGTYLISATQMGQKQPGPKPADGSPEMTNVPTYYPNAVEPSGGSWVRIAGGADVSGADIRMQRAKAVRVSGKVTGAAKDQKVTVRLISRSAGLLAAITGPSAQMKEDGSFEVTGITPGTYIVRASDPTGMKPFGSTVPLEVAGKHIENIALDAAPNPELPGAVRVEGNEKAVVKGARVVLEQIEGLSLTPPNTTVAEDGSFTLKDVGADRYLVHLLNSPKGTYVAAVTFGGQPMPDEGMPLGGVPGKLEIKLRPGGGEIDGVVNGSNDKPMPGAAVALIPNSRRYLLYQSTFTDQLGAFHFKGITPGDYKVFAWEEVEPNAFQNAEFLKPYEGKGEGVSVKENDRKGVTVRVIPAQ